MYKEIICICCEKPILKDDERIKVENEPENFIHAYCKIRYEEKNK